MVTLGEPWGEGFVGRDRDLVDGVLGPADAVSAVAVEVGPHLLAGPVGTDSLIDRFRVTAARARCRCRSRKVTSNAIWTPNRACSAPTPYSSAVRMTAGASAARNDGETTTGGRARPSSSSSSRRCR